MDSPSLAGLFKSGRQGLASGPCLRSLPPPPPNRSRGAAVSRVLRTAALVGVDGVPVEVEVRISSQLPRVEIVGLPEAAVRESAARVRAAIAAAGEKFPDRRVTVNLAPAELRKSGRRARPADRGGDARGGGHARGRARSTGSALVGELALDGRLRPRARRARPGARASRDAGCAALIAPRANARRGRARAERLDVRAAPRPRARCSRTCAAATRCRARRRRAAFAPRARAARPRRRARPGARQARARDRRGGRSRRCCCVGAPGAGKTMLARAAARVPAAARRATRRSR